MGHLRVLLKNVNGDFTQSDRVPLRFKLATRDRFWLPALLQIFSLRFEHFYVDAGVLLLVLVNFEPKVEGGPLALFAVDIDVTVE